MTHKIPDPMAMWTGPTTEAFKVWISFFPVAPFFGVEWRFAQSFPDMATVMPPAESEKATACAEMPEPAAAEPDPAEAEAPAEDKVVAFERPNGPDAAPAPQPSAAAQPAEEPTGDAARDAPADLPPRPANLYDDEPDAADDLKMIKGIGPGLESKLNALGVYRFDQIASFSDDDLVWIDENLTAFKGRCFRDDWVGQARGLID